MSRGPTTLTQTLIVKWLKAQHFSVLRILGRRLALSLSDSLCSLRETLVGFLLKENQGVDFYTLLTEKNARKKNCSATEKGTYDLIDLGQIVEIQKM